MTRTDHRVKKRMKQHRRQSPANRASVRDARKTRANRKRRLYLAGEAATNPYGGIG